MRDMEVTEKPQVSRPRVIHGPHRIRVSGAPTRPALPEAQVVPIITTAEFELAGEEFEVPVEFVTLETPK
jgi:hypothetical protein